MWHTNEVLVLHRPGDAHSVWAFWRGSDHTFLEWYVNLEAPWRRTSIGFDSRDHILDIVIQPDLSSWRWKDEDELAWAIERGRLTRSEGEAARAEGERAIERMVRREAPFDGRWTEWHPDPSWAIPRLPDEWRDYEPRER